MKQAVILAAGEGQRLRPLTATKPKVMLAIAGKPILQYVIESLAQNGIRDIVLVVGYRKEQIFDYIGSGEKLGVELTYVIQESQLGTAHALAQASTAVEKEFLVFNGDYLIEAETIACLGSLTPNTMVLRRVDNPARYGVVSVEGGLVKDIVEKPKEPASNLVNTGIYAFTNEIFNFIGPELDIPDVLNKMISQGYPVTAKEADCAWLDDVVYPWDILSLNATSLRRTPASVGGFIEKGAFLKGPVSVGKDSVIRSNCYIAGPVVIGTGCEIGPNAVILPATSIGDNVVVSSFSEINNSVICNDVSLGSGCIIHDSVIDKGCLIDGRFTAFSGKTEIKVDNEYHLVNIGAILGEDCRLSSGVIAQPGAIIGNCSEVQAARIISGRIPDRSLIL